MNPMTIEIIVLAGIAIFLVLRLRSVLGTRDGFENPTATHSKNSKSPDLQVIEGGPDNDINEHVPPGSDMANLLSAIKKVSPDFKLSDFLKGAKAAYEMILMGFEKGDMDEIRPYLSSDVASAFEKVINDREKKGIKIQAEFAGISELRLTNVEFDETNNVADLQVTFVGELISVAKNADGDIVEGDPKKVKSQKDIWTFSKDLLSDNPNWLLVETDK